MLTEHEVALAPGERVRELSAPVGETAVAEWCAALLAGAAPAADGSPSLRWLGGRHAEHYLRGLLDSPDQDYWPRVWAARGLLYVWSEAAAPTIVQALGDSAWRVREMAAKVARRRELGDAADSLRQCLGDAVPRVRAAAARALGRVGDLDAEGPLTDRLSDADPAVRSAARSALLELARRLDS